MPPRSPVTKVVNVNLNVIKLNEIHFDCFAGLPHYLQTSLFSARQCQQGREDEEEYASSYWMTGWGERKEEKLKPVSGSTKSRSIENSLWKQLRTCGPVWKKDHLTKNDYEELYLSFEPEDMIGESISTHIYSSHTGSRDMSGSTLTRLRTEQTVIRIPAWPRDLSLLCSSVPQPPGRGPVPGPGINYTGPREILLQFVMLVF